uniref:Uncharacterized protein n=1 Tax=Rhizophora mucronata TaxID=61149 RepID=A0A2P2NPS4_RHIMU
MTKYNETQTNMNTWRQRERESKHKPFLQTKVTIFPLPIPHKRITSTNPPQDPRYQSNGSVSATSSVKTWGVLVTLIPFSSHFPKSILSNPTLQVATFSKLGRASISSTLAPILVLPTMDCV